MGSPAEQFKARTDQMPVLAPGDFVPDLEPLTRLSCMQEALGVETPISLNFEVTVEEARRVKAEIVALLEGLIEEGPTPAAQEKVCRIEFAMTHVPFNQFRGPITLELGSNVNYNFGQYVRALMGKVEDMYEPKWLEYRI